MHPIWPHAHSGPCGSIGMWPISPATRRAAAPQLTAFDVAGGDAGADAEVGEVVDGARGRREIPVGAQRGGAHVVLDVHRRRRARRRAARPSSTSSRPMPTLTAKRTVPRVGSTVPGMPTPTASTSLDARSPQPRRHRQRRLQRRRHDAVGARLRRRASIDATTVPSASITAALVDVPPMSTPIPSVGRSALTGRAPLRSDGPAGSKQCTFAGSMYSVTVSPGRHDECAGSFVTRLLTAGSDLPLVARRRDCAVADLGRRRPSPATRTCTITSEPSSSTNSTVPVEARRAFARRRSR